MPESSTQGLADHSLPSASTHKQHSVGKHESGKQVGRERGREDLGEQASTQDGLAGGDRGTGTGLAWLSALGL